MCRENPGCIFSCIVVAVQTLNRIPQSGETLQSHLVKNVMPSRREDLSFLLHYDQLQMEGLRKCFIQPFAKYVSFDNVPCPRAVSKT